MKKIIAAAVLSTAFGVFGCSGEAGTSEELTSESNDALDLRGGSTTARVSCASVFFQRRECGVDTGGGRVTRVRLLEDHSSPAPFICERNNDNYGFGADHIWVDHGCAGDFEVTIEMPSMQRERLRCASNGGGYNVCDSQLRDIRRIRLVRQESGAPCEEGRSFGHYDDAVWVDRGCRGTFEVTGWAGSSGGRRVELFDRGGWSGNRYVANGTINNLNDVGFNDRTESIVVRGGNWELCQHANFNGWCRTFGPGRYDDLGPLAGQVSSIRPR
jgi:hypothetical protein